MNVAGFSRIARGKQEVGAKTVSHICRALDRKDAAQLLQAYLLDEADKIRQACVGQPLGDDALEMTLSLPARRRRRVNT